MIAYTMQRIHSILTSMDQGPLSMDPVRRSWVSSTGLVEDEVYDSGTVHASKPRVAFS